MSAMSRRAQFNTGLSKGWVRLLCGGPYTVPLGKNVALNVYADSRPHNLEVSRLQKGLVLTLNERELIEEGVGFGAPVAMFTDKTYFSGSSQVTSGEQGSDKVIKKHFCMDIVSRKGLKNRVFVDNPLYTVVSDSLAGTYRNYSASRKIIFPLMKLRNKVGIKTFFTKVKPRGEITLTYKIKSDIVDVNVDFIKLQKHRCKRVLLLNEQGSTFFRRFFDSHGLNLTDEKIGAWDLVKAEWACFSDLNNTLSFCVKNLPNSRLFRGSERIPGRLAWAGMGYELNPNIDFFNYSVKICRKKTENS